MFKKAINKRVDERLLEVVKEVVDPAFRDAMAEGSSTVASEYVRLLARHRALLAAWTEVVGTDWDAVRRGHKAYWGELHDPKDEIGAAPWAVRKLLKEKLD